MKGLTLIELLLSIAILSIIAFAGVNILLLGYKFLDTYSSSNEIIRDGNNALEEMVKEIKNGRKATVVISSTTISFSADMNRDAAVENYSYYKNGSQLLKNKDGKLKVLAQNVTGVSFSSSAYVNIGINLKKGEQILNLQTSVIMQN